MPLYDADEQAISPQAISRVYNQNEKYSILPTLVVSYNTGESRKEIVDNNEVNLWANVKI